MLPPSVRRKYEVYVIPAGESECQLLGGTDDKDKAERISEYAVMFGPNIYSKVVNTVSGTILLETES